MSVFHLIDYLLILLFFVCRIDLCDNKRKNTNAFRRRGRNIHKRAIKGISNAYVAAYAYY